MQRVCDLADFSALLPTHMATMPSCPAEDSPWREIPAQNISSQGPPGLLILTTGAGKSLSFDQGRSLDYLQPAITDGAITPTKEVLSRAALVPSWDRKISTICIQFYFETLQLHLVADLIPWKKRLLKCTSYYCRARHHRKISAPL